MIFYLNYDNIIMINRKNFKLDKILPNLKYFMTEFHPFKRFKEEQIKKGLKPIYKLLKV